ncbi:hypothetical protein M758_10G100900, partial [Ceratodon purpureus]
MSNSIGDSADVTVRLETRESSPDISHWGNGAWSNQLRHDYPFPFPPPQTASTVHISATGKAKVTARSPQAATRVLPNVNLNAPAKREQVSHGPNSAQRGNQTPVGRGSTMRSPAAAWRNSPSGTSLHKARSTATPPPPPPAQPTSTVGMAKSGQAERPHVLSSSRTSTYDVKRLQRN